MSVNSDGMILGCLHAGITSSNLTEDMGVWSPKIFLSKDNSSLLPIIFNSAVPFHQEM